jgi:DNA-binding response OmpR family regulator
VSDLAAVLAGLWQQSLPVITGRIATVEAAALAALDGTLGREQRRAAERDAHKLAGSLGTFGYHRGSRHARDLEWLLQGDRAIEGHALLRLTELVVDLQRSIEGPPEVGGTSSGTASGTAAAPPTLPAAPAPPPLVLFVDGDTDTALRLVEAAIPAALGGTAVATVAAARRAVAERRPDLVVLDPATAGDHDLAFLAELGGGHRPLPVLVLTDPGAGVDRVAVARAGGRGFLEKPMAPASVVQVVCRSLMRLAAEAAVLVVDDDPALVGLLERLLPPRGLRVAGLTDPRQVWPALERIRPELLLLDLDMPEVDGLAVCRMVRNDQAWSRLPIVFLTASADPAQVEALFAAGADDHIVKPVVAASLATRLLTRIERSRQQAELWETDARTGLANRQGFARAAGRMLELARRDGRALWVALLQPDLPGRGPAELAGADLAPLLRRSFAPDDVLGVVGEGRLAAALYGRDGTEVVERLGTVLEAVRAEGLGTATAGVARFPDDGDDVGALLAAAAAAAADAQAEGGDRVRVRRPPAGSDARINLDVLVVDDDEALGEVLVYALETRGYRTGWMKDGADARSLLVDPEGLDVRVILLDVGLPGLDGLALLRELARRGVLQRSRVIMVTLRATEAEVLAALDLGAFDHVAKPFSVPVLLHRVRLALESAARP